MFTNHIIDKIIWLTNRAKFIYKESDSSNTISYLNHIKDIIESLDIEKISDENLDSIISKYYIGYDCDKPDSTETDFEFGFTAKEKQELRDKTKSIVLDLFRLLSTSKSDDLNFEFNEQLLHS